MRLHLILFLVVSAGCGMLSPSAQVQQNAERSDTVDFVNTASADPVSSVNFNVRALTPCVNPLMMPGVSQLSLPFAAHKVPNDSKSFILPTWMSVLSYKPERQIRSELRFAGFQDDEIQVFDFFKPAQGSFIGLQAFVAQGDLGRFVVFRGSDSLFDWLSNFETDVVPMPEHFGPSARVHRGFKELFESGFAEIKASLDGARAELKQKPIWVTGHSLGGAQALLFGAALAKSGLKIGAVVTLSQPRVGNLEFTTEVDALLGKRYVKLVRPLDIVPYTPSTPSAAQLAGKFLSGAPIPQSAQQITADYQKSNYAHAGTKYILTDAGETQQDPGRNDSDDLEFFKILDKESSRNDSSGVHPGKKTALIAKRGLDHLSQGMFCLLASRML